MLVVAVHISSCAAYSIMLVGAHVEPEDALRKCLHIWELSHGSCALCIHPS